MEGATQAWLAEQLGCSQSYISQIERARDPLVPGPGIMTEIYVLTSGRVQPNDFYDLPRHGTSEPTSACPSIPDAGVGTGGEGAEGREGVRSPVDRAAA